MKFYFGGLISVILLGIYVHLVRVAVSIVLCVAKNDCVRYATSDFNEPMAQALSVIGGLVSALVIAMLALAKPGEAPAARSLPQGASPRQATIINIVSIFYVLIWIIAGFAAFMIGLYHPKVLPSLTSLGQAWFGLAVSSGYAYLGLKPAKD